MDEIVKLVSEKSGISESQARTAVETVLGYLQDKLPAPLDEQVEKVLKGGSVDLSGDLKKGLGGLFGSK